MDEERSFESAVEGRAGAGDSLLRRVVTTVLVLGLVGTVVIGLTRRDDEEPAATLDIEVVETPTGAPPSVVAPGTPRAVIERFPRSLHRRLEQERIAARRAEAAELATPAPVAPPAPAASGPSTVLVRSVGGLPAGAAAAARTVPGVVGVVPVRAGEVALTASHDADGRPVTVLEPGWSLPLETIAVDPAAMGVALPPDVLAGLDGLVPGRVLLGATSARLRGLTAGATLDVGGVSRVVAGVVDDAVVGSAELVVHPADADAVGLGGVRYLLVVTDGDPEPVRSGVEAALAGSARLLVTTLGMTPWPVAWREVLPSALVKERFGEFAVRDGAGRSLQLDPAWTAANITTSAVPLIGEVTCHRAVIEPLTAAMTELAERSLGHLVDRTDYGGCFSPRRIGAGAPVSRHSWGLAVDLGAAAFPFGSERDQDPRLIEVMARHGFGYGGTWPKPDPMHFEFAGPPAAT